MPFSGIKKVYGEWFDGSMRARALRDKLDPARLQRCILERTGYCVRAYVYTFNGMSDNEERQVVYTLRRDGRVHANYHTIPGRLHNCQPFPTKPEAK